MKNIKNILFLLIITAVLCLSGCSLKLKYIPEENTLDMGQRKIKIHKDFKYCSMTSKTVNKVPTIGPQGMTIYKKYRKFYFFKTDKNNMITKGIIIYFDSLESIQTYNFHCFPTLCVGDATGAVR